MRRVAVINKGRTTVRPCNRVGQGYRDSSRSRTRTPSIIGVSALVYGFSRASTEGWGESLTVAWFVVAIALPELRVPQPIFPLCLLANRNRASAYLNMLITPATMLGMFFYLTQFVQEVLGFSPIKAGFAFLPLSAVVFATSRFVPRLQPRFGMKPLMVTGAALLTAGMFWPTQISADSPYLTDLFAPMLLFGVGAGLSFTPLSLTVLPGVQREDSGAAAGLLQTMSRSGAGAPWAPSPPSVDTVGTRDSSAGPE